MSHPCVAALVRSTYDSRNLFAAAKLLLFARLFQSLARPMELHCVLGGRRLFGGSVPVFMTNFIWMIWTHFVPVNKEFQYVSGHASEFWSFVCLRSSETIIDHHR